MKDFITFLLPIVVAGVTTYLAELLQKAVSVIDALPAVAKQVLVAALAFGLTKGALFLGVQLTSTDLASLAGNTGDITALTSAALAYVFHLGTTIKVVKNA
jgi:hypothetical protein